ncbi:2-iminoacetate synthase [Anaerohalosphaera lusitana]|uniref:2-iminoacetate synthase n=1 Tax=Anaerohalosphaera lusitana TaxID=1936003 RepID=A0A1U9NKL3_9BACT|nr:[FeFe] hydrogenase H-cluster radical SAM maturase HydG [Anaerohalosphaera lusitana]AQT68278.1 2-iminoacetate synthase [Anaerohalosphaera lusitana]
MKHIDAARIEQLLQKHSKTDNAKVDAVLDKARSLQRLTLEETAVLLAADDAQNTEKIMEAAAYVKDAIYGKRVVLFAPLYISNACVNNCRYCGFKCENRSVDRRSLTPEEIKEQVSWLLNRGHKRILMVAGEALNFDGKKAIDYYCDSVQAIYDAQAGKNRIKRVNVNAAPLSVEEFKQLKGIGIGTYQVFQETYHDETYRYMHPSGPKSDPDNRINAIDRAFAAGIDDVGIGVLYGLYDYKFETLAMLMHCEHLENKFNVGPHTISVPRIEPVAGSDVSENVPHPLTDEDFMRLVAILRLSVPYTGIILSTRETPEMRDILVHHGVSQISAESRVSPGGYDDEETEEGIQFTLGDHRTQDEIIGSLLEQGYLPSFCAACYRKERTGERFMSLAKPGAIKGMCQVNALVTLKEYLDDFASDSVKQAGYKLINKQINSLTGTDREILRDMFKHIDDGVRDEYV